MTFWGFPHADTVQTSRRSALDWIRVPRHTGRGLCLGVASLPLASTDFVRYCHATWEVVHTAATWGEFIDRLTAIDDGIVEGMFPDGVEAYLEDAGVAHEDAFGGWSAIEGSSVDWQLPFSGGEDGPYRSWEDDMPDEIIDLADWGTSMVSGDFCYLDPKKVPAVLEVIRARGETAVEDCKLLDELGCLFNGGLPEMPPGWSGSSD